MRLPGREALPGLDACNQIIIYRGCFRDGAGGALLAQQMGLIGAGLYILIGLVYLGIVLVTLSRLPKGDRLEAPLLGYGLAILGAMVGGVFDHFYFNLTFIHIVALYWLTRSETVSLPVVTRTGF